MESISIGYRLLFACLAIFLFNLPFGYLRRFFRKFSFWWFLCIHLPIPAVIFIRKVELLHLTWVLAPFFFGSFFLGQYTGGKWYVMRKRRSQENSK